MQVYDLDKMIELIKSENKDRYYLGTFRYAKVNEGSTNLLKHMTLDEFEELFGADLFTSEEITQYFKKEISDKYGEHARIKKLDRIPKKDLEIGCVYIENSSGYFLYLGKIKGYLYTTSKKGNWYIGDKPAKKEEFEGYCYKSLWRLNQNLNLEEILPFYLPYTTKSVKRFTGKNDEIKLDIPPVYHAEKDGYILHIEFLDVKTGK
jgi:hypothetical protein